MAQSKTAQYQAYSIATRTIAKTRQVVMLYDGAIRFLKQAKDAIVEKRIEDRFKLLLRASEIIVGLRNSIDFDNGGEISNVLERFYTGIDMRILSINFNKNGEAICEEIITDLKQMRDVWDHIDRTFSAQAMDENAAPAGMASSTATDINSVTLSA